MRQAINNLQSTHSGFGFVSPEAVFKVCDLPHPVTVNKIISSCEKGEIDNALEGLGELWTQGYSAVDIVATIFRVTKNNDTMPEYRKLEFIKVRSDRTADYLIELTRRITGNRVHAHACAGRCRYRRAVGRSAGQTM